MNFSRYLIPTLKENPSDAEVVSHQLMLRAGLIRKLAGGIYTWLPMGLRVLRKVEAIVRQEMNAAGAQELLMPGVQPAELWRESGRWDFYGRELLRFVDRHDNEYCLAPTHEEVITDLARREIQSYRDMPLNLYQIQTKFRDEIRPRFGVMRAREFLMKDAYSFDASEDAAAQSYQIMRQAYMRIFDRLGLRYGVVEADSGSIGGSFSHEFMVLADTGEDAIVSCPACGYSANLEKAPVRLADAPAAAPKAELQEVATPAAHTALQVAKFLKTKPKSIAKTMIYIADGKAVAAMVRGDREVNEVKLKNILGADVLELAGPSAIVEVTGGPVGFSGPVGLTIPVYADAELAQIPWLVVGANKADAHYTGFNLGRDAAGATIADLRNLAAGDPCPSCGAPPTLARGIEVGHIFRLGTKYSKALGATYLDVDGQAKTIVMGCYGIGVSRIVAAAIEQGNDEAGIVFPLAIAPVSVAVLPMRAEGPAMEAAQRLHDELWALGVDCLLDDRDIRPGVKFKDSDLLGVPLRVVVGPKGLETGEVELKKRTAPQPEMIPMAQAATIIAKLVVDGGGQSL
ncbi:prolyl-tRNA synthetase [Desulfarculus baarsii DSM 2075]|uniref:Proline--tRNA ligase n=1 Tax=Desulfarculus baarsii (strain ATCC 33931 / DSM 2075 / LMG 7858 / VKM B-1802 / 2st14) TaxID=644282 RepID=E1QG03_DESB2|nr:proline--tRNA ligase [Desulfarculus baarsii]ADK84613.1 prolyl-tRNA synthetase [Desulfarculus baarsii DSM 2075]